MAQQLKDVVKGGDPRNTSHGRGGAGNISNVTKTDVDAKDLSTPTIKGTTYTTGRGGSGKPHREALFMRSADFPAQATWCPTRM